MALRKLETITGANPARRAVIYRDVEWQEYQVKFYLHDLLQKKATYHTGEKTDAQETAKYWVNCPDTVTLESGEEVFE